jgi:chloride channel protein, CIC family
MSAAVDAQRGDFTASPRVLVVTVMAVFVGIVSAFVALALTKLISLFTNIFYYQRFSFGEFTSPAGHHLGVWAVFIPVIGGLLIGLMARYGSEKIRGHGIPEALEAILIGQSRMEAKVAVLKPLSSALSIGTGGPFGAEGPIIMTGGAFGSLFAQGFHLTAAERKTLLVAGAAGGMAAIFATPVAAVLLAVELLLFEWKPRSFIPVASASAVAAALRVPLMGAGPVFATRGHPPLAFLGLAGALILGLLAGFGSGALTRLVYASEDFFEKVPIHWMWWPTIGGLVVGLGGLLYPRALGVGYDVIRDLLNARLIGMFVLGLLITKAVIWAIALGSGTSGGVLAPLLMMGGALGGVEGAFLPNLGPGFWPLVSMGAILGGTMRSPFTGIVFAIELTHDLNMMLPLVVAVTIAHAFTVLTLRRSILTEKVSRRGYHLTREYSIDPLEILFVREVVRTNVVALSASMTLDQTRAVIGESPRPRRRQRLYPVVDTDQRLLGVVARGHLEHSIQNAPSSMRIGDIAQTLPVVAYPDEPLRAVVHRMASTGLTRFPVVERGPERKLIGMIGLSDLLAGRTRTLEAEHRRERVFSLTRGKKAS